MTLRNNCPVSGWYDSQSPSVLPAPRSCVIYVSACRRPRSRPAIPASEYVTRGRHLIAHLTKAVQGRQTVNPRTVLGFLATVLGLVLAASISGIAIIASTKVATYLIPWLLLFCAILSVCLIAGVFIVTVLDPSRLMLGQVTGTEYAEIQKMVLGDSIRGERPVLAVEGVAKSEIVEAVPTVITDSGDGK